MPGRCRPPASVCFVAGFLFGLPALRLEGVYLALATFALAVATPQIPQALAARALDRRRAGHRHRQARRAVRAAAEPGPVALLLHARGRRWRSTSRRATSWRAAAAAPSWRSATTRSRRARWASTPRSTSRSTFGVSAFYTGVAGALGAIVVQFVAPDSFTFPLSIALLVGLVVGGVGWLPGALFGGGLRACSSRTWPSTISQGPVRRRLRRDPDPAHLPHAQRRRPVVAPAFHARSNSSQQGRDGKRLTREEAP